MKPKLARSTSYLFDVALNCLSPMLEEPSGIKPTWQAWKSGDSEKSELYQLNAKWGNPLLSLYNYNPFTWHQHGAQQSACLNMVWFAQPLCNRKVAFTVTLGSGWPWLGLLFRNTTQLLITSSGVYYASTKTVSASDVTAISTCKCGQTRLK